jgi:inorganic pyrophosphatase
VPTADFHMAGVHSIRQIASDQLEDVAEFFRTAMGIEGRGTTILGWLDVEAVPQLLQRCIEAAVAKGSGAD